MWKQIFWSLVVASATGGNLWSQPPSEPVPPPGFREHEDSGEHGPPPSPEAFVEMAMKFDTNQDGKLDRDELLQLAREMSPPLPSSQGRGPEGRGPEGRGPRGPGQAGRGFGPPPFSGGRGEGPSGRDEARGTDGWGREGRGPEGQRPEDRAPEGRGPDGRGAESRGPDGRGAERRGPGGPGGENRPLRSGPDFGGPRFIGPSFNNPNFGRPGFGGLQGPQRGPGSGPGVEPQPPRESPEQMVEKAMEFDRDNDGKLDRAELLAMAREMHGRGGPRGPDGPRPADSEGGGGPR